jgi:PIN domain nuclease of toxin-antitoxin system
MKILLDTHLLLWAAGQPARLPAVARSLLSDPRNQLVYSPASLWEIAIKRGLGRDDFQVDPRVLRRSLIDNDYQELAITGEHAMAVDVLPAIHKDPFDRMLVAQSIIEGITLLTADVTLARYPGPVRLV